MVVAPAAAPTFAQTVDLFTAGQVANSTVTSSTVNGGATVIGTNRDAIYTVGGPGENSSDLLIGSGSAAYTRAASDGSIISIDWDGATNDALTFDPTGLGGMDLTTGGANGFQFNATVNVGTMDFKLLVHSSGTDASSVTVSTATTGAKTVCYSDFSVLGGSGANFASVGAIQLLTFGNNQQDWSIGALTYGVVGGCSLPVELANFSAKTQDRSVALTWTTLSEDNTLGFSVEHQSPSTTDAWNEVGFVDASGGNAEETMYQYNHDVTDYGAHAFRLRIVDLDGSFGYSETVELSIDNPSSFALGSAYPNPFNPSTSFTFSVQKSQQVEIGVYDLLGRNVLEVFSGRVEAGAARTFTVDGSGLTTGLYVVRANGASESRSTTLMLVK